MKNDYSKSQQFFVCKIKFEKNIYFIYIFISVQYKYTFRVAFLV